MDVAFARSARDLLEAGGLDVSYHESDAAHHIDPAHIPAAVDWVAATLGRGASPGAARGGARARRPEYPKLSSTMPALKFIISKRLDVAAEVGYGE